MKGLLEHLRSRPRGTRVAIAMISSLILTAIVALVVIRGNSPHRSSVVRSPGPWMTLMEMIKEKAQKSKTPADRQIIDGTSMPATP